MKKTIVKIILLINALLFINSLSAQISNHASNYIGLSTNINLVAYPNSEGDDIKLGNHTKCRYKFYIKSYIWK
jgi:hypothetical protein